MPLPFTLLFGKRLSMYSHRYHGSPPGTPPVRVGMGSRCCARSWPRRGSLQVHCPGSDSTSSALKRIPERRGKPEPLTTLDEARQERTLRFPPVLPGGRTVLFTSDTFETTEFQDDARIEAVFDVASDGRVLFLSNAQEEAARTEVGVVLNSVVEVAAQKNRALTD